MLDVSAVDDFSTSSVDSFEIFSAALSFCRLKASFRRSIFEEHAGCIQSRGLTLPCDDDALEALLSVGVGDLVVIRASLSVQVIHSLVLYAIVTPDMALTHFNRVRLLTLILIISAVHKRSNTKL